MHNDLTPNLTVFIAISMCACLYVCVCMGRQGSL